jgi:type IV secretion system protein VirB9
MKKTFTKFFSKFFSLTLVIAILWSPSFAQTPITTDSRIRTLVYNPNEVYELKFYYNYQSFIEFSNDEEIEMISVGEAFAWRLTPAGKRLFIRPLEISAHTNMTIITNRRIYHFDIRSDEFTGKADEDLVYTVRFFYPQIGQPLPIPPQLAVPNVALRPRVNEASAPAQAPASMADLTGIINTPIPKARVDEKLPGVIGRNPENLSLNFDYRFSGESDNIMPSKVYDDGNETHFQFANDNLVIPTISVVDANGNETPVTYTIRDRYIVVPIVATQFTLRLADSMLCIYNAKSIQP